MLWQIRKDFRSLFARDDANENYFHPIDGLRSIANIAIVLLHLLIIFSNNPSPYPHDGWKEFVNGPGFVLMSILQLGLEIFFMISGFLVTYKLITQWNRSPSRLNSFVRREYPMMILRRALRFWPGMLLAALVLFIFGEPSHPSGGYSLHIFRHTSVWMFFQNYADPEYLHFTFAPLWTNSLDMQIHITLPLLLYVFYSYRKLSSFSNCLTILLVTSFIGALIAFDSDILSGIELIFRYPLLFTMHPTYLSRWMTTNYNLTYTSDIPEASLTKLYMKRLYFPLQTRFGSFIVGAILASKLVKVSDTVNQSKRNIKQTLFLVISLIIPIIIRSRTFSSWADVFTMLGTIFSRQVFATIQAFILFISLYPSSYVFPSKWIRKFLSSIIWLPTSKLSYFVYLIHWRISFELIYAGPLRFLITYPVTQAALISLPIVLVSTQLISCIWFILVEKPIERLLKLYLQTDYHAPKKEH